MTWLLRGLADLKGTSDRTIQGDSWALDGGAFKGNRDLWGRSFEKGRGAEFGEMLNLSKSPFSFSSNYKSKSSDSSKYLKRGRPITKARTVRIRRLSSH